MFDLFMNSMEHQPDVLTEIITSSKIKRSKLLPWWIKVFMWIFLIFGLLVPIGLVVAFLGFGFHMSLYGIETNGPLSITGLLLMGLFLLKGVVSIGLLKETGWAIKLGIVDALIGIVICGFVMFVYPFFKEGNGFVLSLRLELLLLIPYAIKLRKIKDDWEGQSVIA